MRIREAADGFSLYPARHETSFLSISANVQERRIIILPGYVYEHIGHRGLRAVLSSFVKIIAESTLILNRFYYVQCKLADAVKGTLE